MNDRATRVQVVGPLARYADGFRTVLAQRGYAPSSAAGQLQLMAHVSRWLVQRWAGRQRFDADSRGAVSSDPTCCRIRSVAVGAGYGAVPGVPASGRARSCPACGPSQDAGGQATCRLPRLPGRGTRAGRVHRRQLPVCRAAVRVAPRRVGSRRPEPIERGAGQRVCVGQLPGAQRRVGHEPRRWVAGAAAPPASGWDHVGARITTQLAAREQTGLALLPIFRRGEGDFIGYGGLIVGNASVDEPEIAYELLQRAHGCGYATEAARAVLEAAIATGRTRLWATVRAGTLRRSAYLRSSDSIATTSGRLTTGARWCG